MNNIVVEISKDKKEFVKQTPKESDYKNLITEDSKLFDNNGKLIAVYGALDNSTDKLRNACLTTKYEKGSRTDGMKTQSVIFGYTPRNTVRVQNDICRATGLLRYQPQVFTTFSNSALLASEILKAHNLEQYEKQIKFIGDSVLNEWILKGGAFTSGIVNKDNPLQYHFDSGNFKNSWSVMICFKKKTQGGHLILPEYDLAVEMADNTFIAFSGATTLHGVSPITKKTDGYRYSIVWYPLERMKHCLCASEEIKRFNNVRQKRESAKERVITK